MARSDIRGLGGTTAKGPVLLDSRTPTRNPAISPTHGPDGHPDPVARQHNVEGLEGENHDRLIGRIGEAGAPFQVDSRLQFTADTEGRLFLGVNDIDVENNSGEFTATFTVNSLSAEGTRTTPECRISRCRRRSVVRDGVSVVCGTGWSSSCYPGARRPTLLANSHTRR